MTPRTTRNVDAVLNVPVEEPSGATSTVAAYLTDIFATLWTEGHFFDPREPLGNRDWQMPVYHALVHHGHLPGEVKDGHLVGFDMDAADDLIAAVVRVMGLRGAQRRGTSEPCQVHHHHIPAPHVNERHHIWPVGHGGPDIAANLVVVCATGHNNIHALLAELLATRGEIPYSTMRQFAFGERRYAKLGFDRIARGAM